jgi:hypothetical protein
MLLLNNKLSVETRGRQMTHDASTEKPGIYIRDERAPENLKHVSSPSNMVAVDSYSLRIPFSSLQLSLT